MTYEDLKKLINDPNFDENQFNDFKAEVCKYKEEKDLALDISALANASGGRLFIGVRNDKKFNNNEIYYPVKNWKSMDSEALSNATRQKITRHLSHNLYFTVTPVNRPQGKDPLLIIEIAKSEAICGYRPAPDKSWEFWHRLDRQNCPMGAAEIVYKCLGQHHLEEKLNISNEFCDLLIGKVSMISMAIHMAYKNQTEGKLKSDELIDASYINNINSMKFLVISEAKKTYTNLSSLAFLSANINRNLKKLSISITNKLLAIVSENSIWIISNSDLEKIKLNPVNSPNDVRSLLYQQSNGLIKDYQSLLAIKEEIKNQITQYESCRQISLPPDLARMQVLK